MLQDWIEKIKIKDRDKFAMRVKTQWDECRSWLQDNGEWALIVGVGVGIVFVLFFRLIIVLLVVGGLASYLIWELSSPKSERPGSDVDAIHRNGGDTLTRPNDNSSKSPPKN